MPRATEDDAEDMGDVPAELPSRATEDDDERVRHREPRQFRRSTQLPSVSYSVRGQFSQDEVDQMMEEFAKEDTIGKKSWSRVFVESVLMKYNWYYPKRKGAEAPSLKSAWAYYEHATLPRHFVENVSSGVRRRAEPGESERETDLYDPFCTPDSSLIEWGIGVDLYFSTLKYLAIILLMAGLINVPNIKFYASPSYSDGPPDLGSLAGSTLCDRFDWRACPTCSADDWGGEAEQERFGIGINANGDPITLVKRSACNGAQFEQGFTNWCTLLFLVIFMALMSWYLRAREVRFDEDKLTSTDYSVQVRNPPKNALDPDEWRDFFAQFADNQVTAVTITLNNEEMLWKLILRRINRDRLRRQLPKGTNLDDEDEVRVLVAELEREREENPPGCCGLLVGCTLMPILRIFGIGIPPHKLVDNIFRLEKEIKELQKQPFHASQVFVTFETEEGQRAALTALSIGRIDVLLQNTSRCSPNALFQGTVLRVTEPTEPNAVRWLDLSTSKFNKLWGRCTNFLITIGLVGFCGYLIAIARDQVGPELSGPLTTVFNTLINVVLKLLMLRERHNTEGSWQTSLYLKLTLFRWFNTVILTMLITPFTGTITGGDRDVLRTIRAILRSELWLAPLLRIIDILGNFKKHVLAPRAKNQEEMNLNFQGTGYNLGERYTDMTKILFLCFFYSALFPSTFLFGGVILTIQYFVDKFCLMRIWGWSPFIGSELAVFSRRYFFSGALFAMALTSAYIYAQFPYDNICDPDKPEVGFGGIYQNVQLLNNEIIGSVKVNHDEAVVFCSQNWRDVDHVPKFPPNESFQPDGLQWMTSSQELLTNLYGWTAVVALVAFCGLMFGSNGYDFILSFVTGTYKPDGSSQKIDFSNNMEIFGYVPQIKMGGFPFPFLACNIDDIDQNLIGWSDPTKSYDHWNLMFDIPFPGLHRQKREEDGTRSGAVSDDEGPVQPEEASKRPIFSLIKHYPPGWASGKTN